jgi:hypothetical protein
MVLSNDADRAQRTCTARSITSSRIEDAVERRQTVLADAARQLVRCHELHLPVRHLVDTKRSLVWKECVAAMAAPATGWYPAVHARFEHCAQATLRGSMVGKPRKLALALKPHFGVDPCR